MLGISPFSFAFVTSGASFFNHLFWLRVSVTDGKNTTRYGFQAVLETLSPLGRYRLGSFADSALRARLIRSRNRNASNDRSGLSWQLAALEFGVGDFRIGVRTSTVCSRRFVLEGSH